MTLVAVVDDDADFVGLVSEVLALRGIDTAGYTRSAGVLDELRARQPDVILVDIHMERPDSGWRLIELLDLDETTTDIPLAVCSGASREVLQQVPWLEEHGIPFLDKPFDIDDLYALVDRLVGSRNGKTRSQ